MSNIEVVGLGALNIDHLYRVERILDDGEAVVNEAESFPGGSAANTIYGLAKLRVNTGYTGVVGSDEGGKILLQDFQKADVDTSQISVKPGAKTGSVLCLSDKLGSRSLYVSPGANSLLTMDDLDLPYINQAKWLHLSSFADDRQFKVLFELIDKLDSSVKLSFAPGVLHAIKEMAILSPILKRTHLLFANQREIWHLTGEDVLNGTKSCLEQGCRMVVVTLGKGMRLELGRRTVTAVCYIRDAENEYAIEPSSRDIISEVDATGAGDAFATGFLYGLLKGKGLNECGCLGDIVARFSLTKLGTREGLPTINELEQRYQELYNKEL
ncbi:carbohydrate kinase family protein [Chloroflexota bacterium]